MVRRGSGTGLCEERTFRCRFAAETAEVPVDYPRRLARRLIGAPAEIFPNITSAIRVRRASPSRTHGKLELRPCREPGHNRPPLTLLLRAGGGLRGRGLGMGRAAHAGPRRRNHPGPVERGADAQPLPPLGPIHVSRQLGRSRHLAGSSDGPVVYGALSCVGVSTPLARPHFQGLRGRMGRRPACGTEPR
jgi:hypothetical protein